jgi:hypothetical protein
MMKSSTPSASTRVRKDRVTPVNKHASLLKRDANSNPCCEGAWVVLSLDQLSLPFQIYPSYLPGVSAHQDSKYFWTSSSSPGKSFSTASSRSRMVYTVAAKMSGAQAPPMIFTRFAVPKTASIQRKKPATIVVSVRFHCCSDGVRVCT